MTRILAAAHLVMCESCNEFGTIYTRDGKECYIVSQQGGREVLQYLRLTGEIDQIERMYLDDQIRESSLPEEVPCRLEMDIILAHAPPSDDEEASEADVEREETEAAVTNIEAPPTFH
jgi:hypothetical protein